MLDKTERTASLARALLRELLANDSMDAGMDDSADSIEPRLVGVHGVALAVRHTIRANIRAGVRLGRGAHCEIVLLDVDASREHARVTRRGERVTITDLGSKNGTRVDGQALVMHQSHALEHGALIEIGGSGIRFDDPAREYMALVLRARQQPSGSARAGAIRPNEAPDSELDSELRGYKIESGPENWLARAPRVLAAVIAITASLALAALFV